MKISGSESALVFLIPWQLQKRQFNTVCSTVEFKGECLEALAVMRLRIS